MWRLIVCRPTRTEATNRFSHASIEVCEPDAFVRGKRIPGDEPIWLAPNQSTMLRRARRERIRSHGSSIHLVFRRDFNDFDRLRLCSGLPRFGDFSFARMARKGAEPNWLPAAQSAIIGLPWPFNMLTLDPSRLTDLPIPIGTG